MTDDQFDERRAIAALMGYSLEERRRDRWGIMFPSGVSSTWMYTDQRDAWIDIFDIVGLTDGRLFAGE